MPEPYTDDPFDMVAAPADDGAAESVRHLREVARRQSLLLETMRALTSTLVLEDVLALAARGAGEAMGVFSADINVYAPEENTMTEVAYWALDVTPDDEAYTGNSISLDERPFYYPNIDDPVLVEVQLDDPDFPEQERQIAARWGEHSSLIAPLMYGGRLIGLLGCMEKRWKRRFSDEDKELFRLLAVPAALAIHNAQMFQREEVRSTRLVNLLSAAQRVAGALDREEVARCVEQEITRLFPTRDCTAVVRFLDEAGGVPASAGSVTAGMIPSEPDELPAAALAARKAVRSRAGTPPRLVAPLAPQHGPVGYVDLRDSGRATFTDDEGELVAILLTQAETAFENARLWGELERHAITDGLTGLYNQRYFYERLRQEAARAARLGTPFALLMLDVDDFKLVNDHHGHQAGDEVLRGVARLLVDAVREGLDLPARYGGDEFAVILPSEASKAAAEAGAGVGEEAVQPSTGADPFTAIAERVRSDLEDAPFRAPGAAEPVRITLSGGVARFPRDAQDAESLVVAADKALYLAKRLGKNRVESFK